MFRGTRTPKMSEWPQTTRRSVCDAHTQGDELRTWSFRALKELHTDVALEELHSTLVRNAVQYGTLPLRRGGAAAWFNIYGKHDVTVRRHPDI